MNEVEESYLGMLRRAIVSAYVDRPTGCGASFGEILCWEIHENNMTFYWLAKKWGISLPTLGDLIADHCRRLEEMPCVRPDGRPRGRREAMS